MELKTKLTLFGDKLLLVHEPTEITKAGLVLPDSVNQVQMSNRFRVVAVGDGTRGQNGETIPLKYKEGDFVALNPNTFTGYELPTGEKVYLCSSASVLWRLD